MSTPTRLLDIEQISATVQQIVRDEPVLDMHTHLYSPPFGELLLWGIDELLTYHYLIAELFRTAPIDDQQFWSWDKARQAECIWDNLFVQHSPMSEACRGVLTVLQALGLDPNTRDLSSIRSFFNSTTPQQQVDRVFELARVRAAIMTNDPFDASERAVWQRDFVGDPRFQTALRIDPLLNDWEKTAAQLREQHSPTHHFGLQSDLENGQRFLIEWIERMRPAYLAVSLPPDFAFPSLDDRAMVLEKCVLPVCRDAGLPLALMIGVRRGVNPRLRLAADALGCSDVCAVDALCSQFLSNRFLVTMLARENQHELAVRARKHPNLMIFGCWWFLNIPSMIREITTLRLELLGPSFIPQHSDCRVLEQLIYKWSHSRRIIAEVLTEKYTDLARTGWQVAKQDVQRDVAALFGGNFERFSMSR